MSYVIISDSTTDLTNDFVLENKIDIIPLKFYIEEKEYVNYLDSRELDTHAFYDLMREGEVSKTAQLNMVDIEKCFRHHLDLGNDILCIGFSSGLSGTYNAIRLTAESLQDEYKDRKILTIDSLCASLGEGLLVWYANKFKQEGLSLEENYQKTLDLRLRLAHWFTVDDIDTLRRGGRVTNVQAFLAKGLKIKPVLHVDNDGKLIPVYKKIGRKVALKTLVMELAKTIDRSYKQTIMIGHGDTLEEANYVRDLIRQEVEVEDIYINNIGPVIGAHSGPGTIAIFFIADHR